MVRYANAKDTNAKENNEYTVVYNDDTNTVIRNNQLTNQLTNDERKALLEKLELGDLSCCTVFWIICITALCGFIVIINNYAFENNILNCEIKNITYEINKDNHTAFVISFFFEDIYVVERYTCQTDLTCTEFYNNLTIGNIYDCYESPHSRKIVWQTTQPIDIKYGYVFMFISFVLIALLILNHIIYNAIDGNKMCYERKIYNCIFCLLSQT